MNNRFTSALFVLFALLLATCEKPERDNPWDEKNTLNPEAWAPQNFQVEDVTITEKKLTWTYDDKNIEGFKLDRKKGDESWQVGYQAFSKETRTWNDTEIIPGPSLIYEYRLYAYAGKNKSAEKSESIAVDFPPPTDLQLEKLSDISYKLIWQDNSNGEEGFKIDRKTTDTEWVIGYGTVAENANAFVDTNVFVGKSLINVEYRVYAFYKEYESAKTTENTNASLTPPTDLIITQNSITSVTLNWQDNSTGEQGFKIERKYDGGNWSPLATVTANNYQDDDFTLNSQVHYRVSAYAVNLVSDWIENDFDANIPPPENLSITSNSQTSITLNWNYNYTGHEGFRIDRKVNDSNWELHSTLESNQINFLDNTVNLAENNYAYRLYVFLAELISIKVTIEFALLNVTTSDITNITFTTAIGGGNVTDQGSSPVTARGVCWSNNPSPTLDINLGFTVNGSGSGGFTSSITGLTPSETYYVRAYATNGIGTTYGTEKTFTTLQIGSPTVTTAQVINITNNSAVSGGNVISDGGATVTARGVCWSTSSNPTIADNITSDGIGTGLFASSLTGLTPATTYYVRAYATNIIETAYGEELNFITSTSVIGGFETFDNLPATGNLYQDGNFLGQDGSIWTYVQCRGDYEITGKAITLGRNRDPQSNLYSGTISNGMGALSFDYSQAFSTNVNLNVLINDVVVGNVTSSGEQGVIKNSGIIDVNVEGDFVIKFINENNSDGQVVIDNIEWTAFSKNDPPSESDNIGK
jgi:hypothetical protein